MSEELPPGIYEALVTEALQASVERARAQGWVIESSDIDDASIANILARHIHDQVRTRIGGFPASTYERRQEQIRIANRVLEALAPYTTESERLNSIRPEA